MKKFNNQKNSKIRLFKHKLETIEDLGEEDAAKALATEGDCVFALDTQFRFLSDHQGCT